LSILTPLKQIISTHTLIILQLYPVDDKPSLQARWEKSIFVIYSSLQVHQTNSRRSILSCLLQYYQKHLSNSSANLINVKIVDLIYLLASMSTNC